MRRTGRLVSTFLVHLLLLLPAGLWAQVLSCCRLTQGSCRNACEGISLVAIAIKQQDRSHSVEHLRNQCPNPLLQVNFWSCINTTLAEIQKGDGWWGRPCCHLPQTERCRLACIKAVGLHNLTSDCRHSDEVTFYTCLEKQKEGEECCAGAQTHDCRDACKEVFISLGWPSRQVRTAVTTKCSPHSPQVIHCISDYTHLTPVMNPTRGLHCCDKSLHGDCRSKCRSILRTHNTEQEIVDSLNREGCGPVLPQDALWQCFLSRSDPINVDPGTGVLGVDAARLQCCFRAVTTICQQLCLKTFSYWTDSSKNLERPCKYHPAEINMNRCFDEVEEPCELGCHGLRYCTNFNYRPTELFRSCHTRSDQAARREVQEWEKGNITIPQMLMTIPVQTIADCHPQTWKAIACSLAIKPCHKQAHSNMICKSDCLNILSKCVDTRRLTNQQTPKTICENLYSSVDEDAPCISLESYSVEGRNYVGMSEVTQPCIPNPCPHGYVCIVSRNCIGHDCSPYTCVIGCKVGKESRLIVTTQSYIRVPGNTSDPRDHTVCYCNQQGEVEDCVPQPRIEHEGCWMDNKKIPHNTRFTTDCNICICYAGEVTCTQRHCHSGLPCNCPDHYVPVCGANGKTYPSACLARCAGLTEDQFEFGACFDSDPCSPNSCHPYDRCVPRKRVCLSIRHRSCKQYDCVNTQQNCNLQPKVAVCDTENVEHTNLCWMLQRKKTLAHFGPCMHNCRSSGPVCGHNGETYASECTAWAERVSVDYTGPCVAVGFSDGAHSRCSGVKCPPFPSEHCTKVIPPGGCCPICGAALRLLYSQKLADWSVKAVRNVDPVVLQTIAEKLRSHVQVTECDVFAYLSPDSGIIVLVSATADSPTPLQVDACIREAEKLEMLIRERIPTLLTELPLSFITTATLIQPVRDGSAPRRQGAPFLVAALAAFFLITRTT